MWLPLSGCQGRTSYKGAFSVEVLSRSRHENLVSRTTRRKALTKRGEFENKDQGAREDKRGVSFWLLCNYRGHLPP